MKLILMCVIVELFWRITVPGKDIHLFLLGVTVGEQSLMPKQMIDISITDFKVEESESGDIELIYTPNQTQTLYRNQQYRFVFSEKIILERVLKKDKVTNAAREIINKTMKQVKEQEDG
jgi:hypothetical protein